MDFGPAITPLLFSRATHFAAAPHTAATPRASHGPSMYSSCSRPPKLTKEDRSVEQKRILSIISRPFFLYFFHTFFFVSQYSDVLQPNSKTHSDHGLVERSHATGSPPRLDFDRFRSGYGDRVAARRQLEETRDSAIQKVKGCRTKDWRVAVMFLRFVFGAIWGFRFFPAIPVIPGVRVFPRVDLNGSQRIDHGAYGCWSIKDEGH